MGCNLSGWGCTVFALGAGGVGGVDQTAVEVGGRGHRAGGGKLGVGDQEEEGDEEEGLHCFFE